MTISLAWPFLPSESDSLSSWKGGRYLFGGFAGLRKGNSITVCLVGFGTLGQALAVACPDWAGIHTLAIMIWRVMAGEVWEKNQVVILLDFALTLSMRRVCRPRNTVTFFNKPRLISGHVLLFRRDSTQGVWYLMSRWHTGITRAIDRNAGSAVDFGAGASDCLMACPAPSFRYRRPFMANVRRKNKKSKAFWYWAIASDRKCWRDLRRKWCAF